MAVESAIKFGIGQVTLAPAPIRRDWILEGNPVASNKLLSASADGTATSYIWHCTAGRFNWYYDVEETIYVLEGGVVIIDMEGTAHRLGAGDTIFFPAGTHAEWKIESYIRKVAFIRTPLPRSLLLVRRGYRFLKRLTGNGDGAQEGAAMFQNS